MSRNSSVIHVWNAIEVLDWSNFLMHVCKVSQLFLRQKNKQLLPSSASSEQKVCITLQSQFTAQCIQEGIHVPCVRPR